MIPPWTSKSVPHKWTLEEASKLTFFQINKMRVPERAELANYLQNQLRLRVMSYNRAKTYNHPFAYEKLQKDFKELIEASDYNFDFNAPVLKVQGRKRMLSDEYAALSNPGARLLSYITQLQDFFASKSSTVAGWKDVIRNESMKLFGYKEYKTKKGSRIVLNHLMTEEEREYFWKLYEEIRKSGKVAFTSYVSESMKVTGFLRIWREKQAKGEWDYNDLTGMMNQMLQSMKESGTPVRDFPEHVQGRKHDPFHPEDEEDEDSIEFKWE